MQPPDPQTVDTYTALLQRTIWVLRSRLRYGETISPEELIDYLDAIENIPTMLRNYGAWNVEENIEAALGHYDQKWMSKPGSDLRESLLDILWKARNGEFDR